METFKKGIIPSVFLQKWLSDVCQIAIFAKNTEGVVVKFSCCYFYKRQLKLPTTLKLSIAWITWERNNIPNIRHTRQEQHHALEA
jgi:hypothetical protein